MLSSHLILCHPLLLLPSLFSLYSLLYGLKNECQIHGFLPNAKHANFNYTNRWPSGISLSPINPLWARPRIPEFHLFSGTYRILKLTSEFNSNRKPLLPYRKLWVFLSTKCMSISKTAMVPERRTRGGFTWTQLHDFFSQGSSISFCLWCSGSENWLQFGNLRTSLVVQWIKIHLPVQWTWTWSLDSGRFHILQSN